MMFFEKWYELYSKLNESNSIWIGTYPVSPMYSVQILHSTGYRVSSSLHGKFNRVWLYEIILSEYKNWKLILDEVIRLINKNGQLIIRIQQNDFFSIIELKSFLFRHIGLDNVTIDKEYNLEDNEWIIIFNIDRKDFHIYNSDKWTFCIITQGNKNENVIKFLDSIRLQDEDYKHQILILGPNNDEYNQYNVDYLDYKIYRNDLAEISKKKNDLIEYSKNENILIVHDRYMLDKDFLINFDKYGYDFDFLTVAQSYECGTFFPAYAIHEKGLIWSKVYYIDDYRYFTDQVYLNGGLIIGKKSILKNIKFNDILFWNQAEDVELSLRAVQNSIVPRINFISSAITLGLLPSYTNTFIKYNGYFEKEKRNTIDSFNKKSLIYRIFKKILPSSIKEYIRKVVR